MAPSDISSTKRLTTFRSVTFIVLLSLSAWTLTFKLNYATILTILNIIQLGLEHLLGMVQPVTLSTLNRHWSMIMLNSPLNLAWIICNGFYSHQIWQRLKSTNTPLPKTELLCKWMVAAAFFIHIVIGAVQVREEIQREQQIPTMPKEVEVW